MRMIKDKLGAETADVETASQFSKTFFLVSDGVVTGPNIACASKKPPVKRPIRGQFFLQKLGSPDGLKQPFY